MRYEQQTSEADLATARKLADALGVPLAYLYADTDELAELILTYTKLPKAKRVQALLDLKALLRKPSDSP